MSDKNDIYAEALPFMLESKYQPAGGQIDAIKRLNESLLSGRSEQVLLGVTGSGKTFTMANVIQQLQRPAIIMVHNKTLAAQLYSEMKSFFPRNSVEYFISFYDYYQPEAYLPKSATYIEKDAVINEHIELMRHSATSALMCRSDVIIVASVSSIYGLGSPDFYRQMTVKLHQGMLLSPQELLRELTRIQYKRDDLHLQRGAFQVRGDRVTIFPSYSHDLAICLDFCEDEIEAISEIDPLTNRRSRDLQKVTIFANTHFATPHDVVKCAVRHIGLDLEARLQELYSEGKVVEAQRLEKRTRYDMEMLIEMGSCRGIENYSRYLDNRQAGSPPSTLFSYLPDNALLFVDESHVSLPQIRAMYAGDRARKLNLVEHGFRLPSALDNRPLRFDEWNSVRPQTVYVSATPADYELSANDSVIIEQIIRPTGLVDPVCIVKPTLHQVDDVVNESRNTIARGLRIMIITLTKKMAENLSDYLSDIGVKATYLHSEVSTLERIRTLKMLRLGTIDVVIGVNLLREGLDVPECGLVAILDADKEGFLRSKSSLIQMIGRAARNDQAKVILYADVMTNSINAALQETQRRRNIQCAHNERYNITPITITKPIDDAFDLILSHQKDKGASVKEFASMDKIKTVKQLDKAIAETKRAMATASKNLLFEEAIALRERLQLLYARGKSLMMTKK